MREAQLVTTSEDEADMIKKCIQTRGKGIQTRGKGIGTRGKGIGTRGKGIK